MCSRFIIGLLLGVALAVGQQPVVPEFVSIPAGEYSMGSTEGANWEQPAHRVQTPALEIAARPISNREFQAFRPSHRSAGDQSPNAPVTGVTWNDAMAYSEWLQGQLGAGIALPTEARWERAVRGDLDQQTYPWGNEFNVNSVAAPGAKAAPRANPFGMYAITYNLWEWAADWYAPDYYGSSPEHDPQGPTSGEFRVLRGGGFRSDPASATCYSRGSARPATSSAYVTFRVMKTGRAPIVQVTEAPKPTAPVQPTDTVAAHPPTPLTGGLNVTAIEFGQSGTGLEIRLATSAQAAYRSFALVGPDRLVVDIDGAVQRITKGSGTVAVGMGGVNRIRYAQFQLDPPITRVVVDLTGPVGHQIETTDTQILLRLSPKN